MAVTSAIRTWAMRGLVLVDNRRTRFNAAAVDELRTVATARAAFDAGYTDVSFEEQVLGAQVDYTTADVSAALVARMQ